VFQESLLPLAVYLTMSDPPGQAAAPTAAESNSLAAATPASVLARARRLHLSSAHKG
jgi:hypothetical protein